MTQEVSGAKPTKRSSLPPKITSGGMFGGAIWVAGSRLVVRLLGLLSTLVLARLLTPADFGLVAIATSASGLLLSFTELGFGQALIHYRDATEKDYATAWTLNVIRGLFICVLLLLLSYPISRFSGEPRVFPLLLVLSIQPILDGLENPRFLEFEKAMRFDVIFRIMVFTKIIGVSTTIIGAVIWHSYWVLIAGMLATSLTRTILTYVYAPFKVWPEVSAWRRLVRFSGWLTGAEIIAALGNRLDPLIIGAFSAPQVVGLYFMALELTWTIFNEVASPLRRVLFPALVRHGTGSPEFVSSYQQALSGLFMFLAPVILGFGITAPDAVPILLGSKWEAIILPIQYIAFALTFTILGRLVQSVAMAAGQTRMIFNRTLYVVPIKLLAFVGGTSAYGLDGAVFGLICGWGVETVINLRMSSMLTGIPIRRHFFIVVRSFISLLGMTVVVVTIGWLLGPAKTIGDHALRLILAAGGGALCYASLHLICWRVAGYPYGPEASVMNQLRKTAVRILGR